MSSHSSFPPVSPDVDNERNECVTEAGISARFDEVAFALKSDRSFEDPYTLRRLSDFVRLLCCSSALRMNFRKRVISGLIDLMRVSLVGLRTRYALFKAIDMIDPGVECPIPIGESASDAVSSMNDVVDSVRMYFDYLRNVNNVYCLPDPTEHYNLRSGAFAEILHYERSVLVKIPSIPLPPHELSRGEKAVFVKTAFLNRLIALRDARVIERHAENCLVRVAGIFGEEPLDAPEEMN